MTRTVIACLGAMAIVLSPQASAARVDQSRTAAATGTQITHRVVWDAFRNDPPLIKILSANPDGTDKMVIYRHRKGFVLDLTLDRQGTRVAMAPVLPRRRPASLIVADVLGGGHINVLAEVRRFDFVGGVGWSPNGQRLVFEGTIPVGSKSGEYLWTIRPDGTGLRRITRTRFDPDRGPTISNNLAWTSRGIFFLDSRGLVLFNGNRHRVLLRNAWAQWISGNGRWLYVERVNERASLWRMHPNGTGLERIIRRTRPHPTMGYLTQFAPDYTGQELLTVVDDTTLAVKRHPSDRAPEPMDPELDFTGHGYVITWN